MAKVTRDRVIKIYRSQNGFVATGGPLPGEISSPEQCFVFQSSTALADWIEQWAVEHEGQIEVKCDCGCGRIGTDSATLHP